MHVQTLQTLVPLLEVSPNVKPRRMLVMKLHRPVKNGLLWILEAVQILVLNLLPGFQVCSHLLVVGNR
jgi:hypothetical protein